MVPLTVRMPGRISPFGVEINPSTLGASPPSYLRRLHHNLRRIASQALSFSSYTLGPDATSPIKPCYQRLVEVKAEGGLLLKAARRAYLAVAVRILELLVDIGWTVEAIMCVFADRWPRPSRHCLGIITHP